MKTKTLLLAVLMAHTAVAHAASTPFAWGTNSYGQIGDGTTTDRLTATAVDMTGAMAGKTITAIAAAVTGHTLAVSSDGKVYAWGRNSKGELGDGTTTDRLTPVAVDMSGALAGKTVVSVAAGFLFSIATTSDGLVYAWGYNDNGQLGDGTTTDRLTPVAVDMTGALLGKTVTGIAAGFDSAAALTSDGLAFCWGDGSDGQMGNGGTTDSSVPVAVTTTGVLSGKTISRLGAGQNYYLVAATDGKLYGWGSNTYSQLGNGSTTDATTPVAVDTSGVLATKTMIKAAGGASHSVGLSSDGKLYSWGYNGSRGLLGDGTTTDTTTPVAVDMTGALSGKTVSDIAIAGGHNLVLTDDGMLFSWGSNDSGQLGDGTITASLTPIAVDMSGALSGMSPTALSAGVYASIVLASPSVSTITPAARFTYAANFGWLNWRWSAAAPDAPVIETTLLHGKVYSANVGWIDLGDGTPSGAGSHYAQSGGDIGVNHDGAGGLSGYAYGASIGWIYFDPTIAAPPRVNLITGAFSGYAYSANCGWIHLASLKTRLHPGADSEILAGGGSGDGIADTWEQEKLAAAGLGNNLALLGSAPGSDYDHDGQSDYDEYLADTNPFSPGNRLNVTGFHYDPLTGNIDLDWTGSNRRAYTVYCSSDLLEWTPVGTTQTGNTAALTLGAQTASHLFFRVGAALPLAP